MYQLSANPPRFKQRREQNARNTQHASLTGLAASLAALAAAKAALKSDIVVCVRVDRLTSVWCGAARALAFLGSKTKSLATSDTAPGFKASQIASLRAPFAATTLVRSSRRTV